MLRTKWQKFDFC